MMMVRYGNGITILIEGVKVNDRKQIFGEL